MGHQMGSAVSSVQEDRKDLARGVALANSAHLPEATALDRRDRVAKDLDHRRDLLASSVLQAVPARMVRAVHRMAGLKGLKAVLRDSVAWDEVSAMKAQIQNEWWNMRCNSTRTATGNSVVKNC